MCTVFTNQQTKPPTGNLPKRNQPSHAQFSQAKYVGAVPVCPPERPHSGVSIREIGFVYHALCAGNLTTNAPLQGDAGGHTGTAPTNLHQTTRRAITSSHCTFDSSHQPHGVPIPRSGYTFDSAGLASATQPTLGNGSKQVVLPTTWVVLFLIAHHYHTRRMDYSRMISPHEN